MYHMVDDIETQQEERNSMNVIDDFLIVEKRTTMERTGETQIQYNDIIIPESDIDPTKSTDIENVESEIQDPVDPTQNKRKVKKIQIQQFNYSIITFPINQLFNIAFFHMLNSATKRQLQD